MVLVVDYAFLLRKMGIEFKLHKNIGNVRRGEITTTHGVIQTPAFMPVGTSATVKAMTSDDIKATGAQIILGNTYHLMLRPGAERINKLGGLHRFMNWDGPILTDSGGFQVMSLSKLRKITDDGVTFRSHIDGSSYTMTPQRSVHIQYLLGSDITMCFDECTPYPCDYHEAERSMLLSMQWAEKSKKAFIPREGYSIFGILQGSIYQDLRIKSAKLLTDIGFDGYAIGGLAVGEGQKIMFDVLDLTMKHIPKNKPRYLMGVGKPSDIVGSVLRGVDMFDCVLPSRSGRNGQAFVRGGAINIRNQRYSEDLLPLDEQCSCYTCIYHSRAYLHHLVKCGEILGPMLMTRHNLHFYQDMMIDLRLAIEENKIEKFVSLGYY